MEKISWKRVKGDTIMGYVDKEITFCIEGRLCLTDLRNMNTSQVFIPPKHYRLNNNINEVTEAKLIAHELLNNINLEKHEANWQAWKNEGKKTVNLLAEADAFLKSLKNK